MNILRKKLKFHRPDEMEKDILFRAQRNAYIFLIAALFLWSLYESYQVYHTHSQLNPLPCFLLVAAVLIQLFSQSILTRNAVKDDTDSYETAPFVKIIILICIAISLIIAIVGAMIFTGAKI